MNLWLKEKGNDKVWKERLTKEKFESYLKDLIENKLKKLYLTCKQFFNFLFIYKNR